MRRTTVPACAVGTRVPRARDASASHAAFQAVPSIRRLALPTPRPTTRLPTAARAIPDNAVSSWPESNDLPFDALFHRKANPQQLLPHGIRVHAQAGQV